MSLTGRPLVIALVVAALVGVVVGDFAAGWKRARGLAPMECGTDAGVKVAVDAGVTEQQQCAAAVEHWTVVRVPGPTRYLPADGGIERQPETITVLVPELRLSAQQGSQATAAAGGEAMAQAFAVVRPGAEEKHWEVGPAVFRTPDQSLWVGVGGGWSAGPFGIRASVLGNERGVGAGVGVVWRF